MATTKATKRDEKVSRHLSQKALGMALDPGSMMPSHAGRCQTCRYWKHDHLAEHRGHGIRPEVQWRCCTREGYLAARMGHAYTAADFGCLLWEAVKEE